LLLPPLDRRLGAGRLSEVWEPTLITLVSLAGRLKAQIELHRDKLPVTEDQAMSVVRLLAPHIMDIMRDNVADAKRDWTQRLERQK
jgi:hypothetical protein